MAGETTQASMSGRLPVRRRVTGREGFLTVQVLFYVLAADIWLRVIRARDGWFVDGRFPFSRHRQPSFE
jgi:hypothetical protein